MPVIPAVHISFQLIEIANEILANSKSCTATQTNKHNKTNKTNQGKTRLDKTRQDKIRQKQTEKLPPSLPPSLPPCLAPSRIIHLGASGPPSSGAQVKGDSTRRTETHIPGVYCSRVSSGGNPLQPAPCHRRQRLRQR